MNIQKVTQQELLMKIAVDFASNRELGESLYTAVKMLGEYLNADKIAVVKMREDGVAETIADWAASPEYLTKFKSVPSGEMDPGGTMLGKLRQGKIFFLTDPDIPDSFKATLFKRLGVRNLFSIPIFSANKYWGFMAVHQRKEVAPWNEEAVHLAEAVCGNILLGIERKENLDGMVQRDRELQDAIKTAEKSDRAKTEFLSRMSHEIRTPMNAIIGMTKIAADSSDMAKIKSCLNKIDAASKQLLGIINDILDMSKIEAGKLEIDKQPFNLESALQNICTMILVKSDEKKQNLHMYIGRGVPNILNTDEMRLSQVLINLLSNAVKFTPEGGDIKVSVSLKKIEGNIAELEFAVSDNGIGMTDDQQKRLFTAFEQGDGGIARRFGGTGLGLSISKNIVELLGGKIRAESAPDKGSKFIFTIKAEAAEGERRTILSKGTSLKNLKVLTVDDSDETRLFIGSLMAENNIPSCEAETAERGLEMLEAAQKEGRPFTLVFMDWNLPGINGLDAAKIIKDKYNGGINVVLISASDWSGNIERSAAGTGIRHFLHKPLFSSMIINTVNEILGVPETENAGKALSAQTPDFKGNTVLVAEDVEINRDILSALLEPTRVALEYAENGKIAVDMFNAAQDKYGLILMDIHMPEMDGYEATRRIRALGTEKSLSVPIIAMTANVFSEDVRRCIEAGMNGHTGKPVDYTKLINKLAEYLKINKAEEKKMDNVTNAAKDVLEYMPFIDIADGLNRIRGNKKLYGMMLKSFKATPQFPQAKAAVLAGDLKTAQMQMHTLKGVAGNLSLKRLFELVVPVEAVLKTTMVPVSDLAPIEEAFDKTMVLIDELLAQLKAEGF